MLLLTAIPHCIVRQIDLLPERSWNGVSDETVPAKRGKKCVNPFL